MPPRACGGLSRGARPCSRAGSTAERRHGARARLLGMGGRPHGRGGAGGGGPPHISRSPRKRLYPKPLRRTSGPFSASAQGATRVHRLSVRRRSLSRSNGLPGERSPRADIKLQRQSVGKTRRGRRGRADIGRGPDPTSLGPGPILPLDNVLLILKGQSLPTRTANRPIGKGCPRSLVV